MEKAISVTQAAARGRRLRAILKTTTLLMSGFAAPALAQTQQDFVPGAAPAVNSSIDVNGVDLFSGKIKLVLSSLAIGPEDETGLSYVASSDGPRLRDSVEAYIFSQNGTNYKVIIGAKSFTFTKSGTLFSEVEVQGNALTYDGSNYYTFTTNDGTIYRFSYLLNLAPNGAGPDGYDIGALTDLTSPSGAVKTYTYRREVKPILNGRAQVGSAAFRRIQSIVSNTGWMIKPEYAADVISADLTNWEVWSNESTVKAFNNNVVGCNVAADHCTIPAGQQWPEPISTGYATNGPDGITSFRRLSTPVGTNNLTVNYTAGRVSSVVKDGVSASYSYSDGSGIRTTTRTTAAGVEEYKFVIATGLLKQFENALGDTTIYEYNSANQLVKVTYPEGNRIELTRDSRNNITQTKAVAKSGSTDAPITTSASYPVSCSSGPSCNKPIWTRDAKGNQTDYTYDPTHGGVLTVTQPASASGVRPQTRYGYTAEAANVGAVVRLTSVSSCQTVTTCTGTADETRATITYGSVSANNLQPLSTTVASGNGALSMTETMTYTAAGDLATIDGPLPGNADTSRNFYDSATRRITGSVSPDPDGSGPLKNRAMRWTYNADGQPTLIEQGTVSGQSDTDWNGFSVLRATATTYDVNGREVRSSVMAGGTTYAVRQTSYDGLGRPDCTAVRMNSALWGTLPASACTAQTTGSAGPDRITKVAAYDALNRATSVTSGYGVSGSASTESTSYNANGTTASITDGEGNKTTYLYDGFDRLSKTEYPSPTKGSGTSSTTDYEQLGYDANGNVTSRRLRDGTSIDYTYDQLNRLTLKNLPGSEPDVNYIYDLLGRLTGASQTGSALVFAYDALGRLLSEAGPEGTMTSTWDAAGRRTRLQWPDGFFVNYDYDVLGEMTKVRENGATTGIGVLASYSYNDLGDRLDVANGNGSASSWTPDAMSRLATLIHHPAGSANWLTRTFSYNPAGGIASMTSDNDAYAWNGAVNVNRTYTTNGLNQYTASGGTTLGYDARGNMTSSGINSYTYSSENLLKSGPGGVVLTYDPQLRLFQVVQGSAVTRFGYDGLNMVAEYNGSNLLQRRYIYGPGTDEPIVWYEGAGTTGRRWLHTDERGSVIAVTGSTGSVVAGGIDSYDEYGIPSGTNIGRFQYTGQAWLPELGIYYYKARMYSPTLGRFMQTDPIGYDDGPNWYNYVGSDPVNSTDPLGLDIVVTGERPLPTQALQYPGAGKPDYQSILSSVIFANRGGTPGPKTALKGLPGAPQKTQCSIQVAPGTGSTPDELRAQARINGAEAAKRSAWSPSDNIWFRNQVRNGGPWDYKQYSKGNPSGYQSFGNYNYGYTGAAMGYSLNFLLRQAGKAQTAAGTSQPGWGDPGNGFSGGTPPYGDDPNDQASITEGFNDRKNGC